MALVDTLTTREALRRATLDDIVARCELASTVMEGGPLDGINVVSMGVLRDQVTGSLMVHLPPPSEKFAEVTTPATVVVSAICPECDLPVVITVKLGPKLTVDDDGAELSIKASSKGLVHVHGQLSLPVVDGQVGMDGVIGDLRLRILRAVNDVVAGWVAEVDQGPAPTLDAIALRMEIAFEKDRGDLEDSLYSYSQLDPPLVEVISAKGSPVTYRLTADGETILDAADDFEGGENDDQDEAGESDDDLRKRIEGDDA